MKKSTIYICIGSVLFIIIVFVSLILNKNKTAKTELEDIKQLAQIEDYEDECTQEYEEEKVIQTSSKNIRISPNAEVITYKHYKGCDHDKKEIEDVPKEVVNMDEEEVKKYYSNEEVKDITEYKIELYKEYEGVCNEHYIIKEKDGHVAIFTKSENNLEELFEETEIECRYLPETDRINLKNGINVVGREELNKVIEDYE